MWVLGSRLLGGRPICCTVHQSERIGRKIDLPWKRNYNEDDIRCDLCWCDIEQDYLVKFLSYTIVRY